MADNLTDRHNGAKLAVNRVAWSIVERAAHQAWKHGKKADGLAVEAAVGALAAAIAFYGDDAPETQAMSFFAVMVGTRGYPYAKERAAMHTPHPLDEAEQRRHDLANEARMRAGG